MRHSGGLLLAATLLCLDAVVAVPVAEDALPVLLPQKKHGLGPRIMRGIVQLRQLHIRGAVRFHELVWRRRSPKTNRDGRRVAEVVRSFLVAGLRISPKEGYPDFANEKAIRPGNLLYGEYKLYPDHSWAQVMRFGSGCNAGIEGLSAGWPTDCGSNYTKMGRPELSNCTRLGQGSPARVGYGCWFFFSDPFVYRSNQTAKLVLGHASGVAVNVGKSLRVDTRADASAALALPCDNPPLCDKENTVQDKVRVCPWIGFGTLRSDWIVVSDSPLCHANSRGPDVLCARPAHTSLLAPRSSTASGRTCLAMTLFSSRGHTTLANRITARKAHNLATARSS